MHLGGCSKSVYIELWTRFLLRQLGFLRAEDNEWYNLLCFFKDRNKNHVPFQK